MPTGIRRLIRKDPWSTFQPGMPVEHDYAGKQKADVVPVLSLATVSDVHYLWRHGALMLFLKSKQEVDNWTDSAFCQYKSAQGYDSSKKSRWTIWTPSSMPPIKFQRFSYLWILNWMLLTLFICGGCCYLFFIHLVGQNLGRSSLHMWFFPLGMTEAGRLNHLSIIHLHFHCFFHYLYLTVCLLH